MVFDSLSWGLKRPDGEARAPSEPLRFRRSDCCADEARYACGTGSVIQPHACNPLMQNSFRENSLHRMARIDQLIRQNVSGTSR